MRSSIRSSEWDIVPGESGHRAPRAGFDEDESLGEQLVTGGLEEAAHDQMLEAPKRIRNKKADPLSASNTLVVDEPRRAMSAPSSSDDKDGLIARFRQVRDFSTRLCRGLQPEDYVVQSMPDVSPTKWHLAHTRWFFETFVLKVWMRALSIRSPAVRLPLQFLLQRRRRHASARSARIDLAPDRAGNLSLSRIDRRLRHRVD